VVRTDFRHQGELHFSPWVVMKSRICSTVIDEVF